MFRLDELVDLRFTYFFLVCIQPKHQVFLKWLMVMLLMHLAVIYVSKIEMDEFNLNILVTPSVLI